MATNSENEAPEKILWNTEQNTVLSRTSVLLNSDVFSDVLFVVGEGGASQEFYAHKLLLSLSSPVFADMFKDHVVGQEIVRVPDISPHAFYSVLKYLYTDVLEFADYEEALKIYSVSVKYRLLSVQSKCDEYLCCTEKITQHNVCSVFENAYLINATKILEKCYKIFEENTHTIFQSSQFKAAKQSTVEAMLKREKMNIDSEYEVIDAVMKWGAEECRRKDVSPDNENVRLSVRPFLKHIRFFSLPKNEFFKLIKNGEILTPAEACRIIWNLSQPHSDNIGLPPEMCANTQKRICPLTKSPCVEFPFPLCRGRNEMSAQFDADIKSVIHITMLKGRINVIGVELHIKRRIIQIDSLNVFLKLSNKFISYEEEHLINVTGEPLRIIFEKPLHVSQEETATATITIEDLAVNRCLSCRQLSFESMTQSGVNFFVNLHGNKESDGIVCLVKALFYNSC